MQLFTSSNTASSNDPWVVNPKGVKVQVPESSVKELLRKGFVLVDKGWAPSTPPQEELIERDYPLSKKELEEQLSIKNDMLDCEEV